MNSKKTKAVIETMHREMMAKTIQTVGVRPGGATMVVEHGTAELATKQVYLRFVGVMDGARFESAQSGPWDAYVDGGLIMISPADKTELDGEKKGLEDYSHATGLKVQVAEVGEGSQLGEWRAVEVQAWTAPELEPGTLPSRATLQAEVNRLHAERDPLVVKARAARMRHGVTSPEFARAWFDVERLTADLVEAEAALEEAGPERFEDSVCDYARHLCHGIELLPASWMATECSILAADLHAKLVSINNGTAAKEAPAKAWRDEDEEIPDDGITVVLRTRCDDDEAIEVGYREAGAWWIGGADTMALGMIVTGWMHMHEALELLDAAVRKAVSNG